MNTVTMNTKTGKSAIKPMFDSLELRKDFPVLERVIDGNKLVYLDNAATSQKPQVVIDSLVDYYQNYNSNVHRGIHTLSQEATDAFENVRNKARLFIDAASEREIIFTRNATEAVNLVAYSWGDSNISEGDEIVVSIMEHHSNFVPWQALAERKNAKLVIVGLTAHGELDMAEMKAAINEKTKLVAVTQMSNVLGTITPLNEIIALAHKQGALVLVDGAQGVTHLPTSVRELDCDFLVFSMHKMLGPTGVGVLWGRETILNQMPPFQYGGDMISIVKTDRTRYNELPWKFEAGTPNVADVIASGAAFDYLEKLGMENVRRHELELTEYAMDRMNSLQGMKILGPGSGKNELEKRGGVISFLYGDVHPHDLGQILNESGIAVRAGHHCCQPLMTSMGIHGTARASFYVYNTREEVDFLVESMKTVDKVLGK